jgi:two-component system, OmpR family, sensor histidine kinase KdpD
MRDDGPIMMRSRWSPTALLTAAGGVAVVTIVIYALREVMPAVATGVVYMLPVLLVSSLWGLWPGVATSVASAAAFNFFHIPPTGRFTIADEQHWVALIVFLVAAGVTSTLAGNARIRAEEAERGRREADLSAEMARVLLGGESLATTLPVVGRRIAQAFEIPWVTVEAAWADSDERRRALPIVVDGVRSGTVSFPRELDPALVEAIQRRVIPSLETLLSAASQREGLEAQLVETRALRRANVVKTALLRSVSHDLRSPLTAITAAAGGLRSKTLDPAQRDELIAVITAESTRLGRLVDNLLDLSRLQAGQVESRADWCSIEELVEAAIASVGQSEDGFEVVVADGLPMVRGDAGQLERALANVLDNSRRFAGEQPVTVNVDSGAQRVMIRITDRGPGIPQDQLETVFEPFHRGPDSSAGSGLGLAIARGFIEANGGTIRAQSLPGQGSTFLIQLPVPTDPDPEPTEAGR